MEENHFLGLCIGCDTLHEARELRKSRGRGIVCGKHGPNVGTWKYLSSVFGLEDGGFRYAFWTISIEGIM